MDSRGKKEREREREREREMFLGLCCLCALLSWSVFSVFLLVCLVYFIGACWIFVRVVDMTWAEFHQDALANELILVVTKFLRTHVSRPPCRSTLTCRQKATSLNQGSQSLGTGAPALS